MVNNAFRATLSRLKRAHAVDWDAVYAQELPRVYNYLRYRIGDDDLAAELTSATFENAWRGRDSYKDDRAGFATWLIAIARNTAASHFRARKNTVEHVPLDALPNLADAHNPPELVQTRMDHARLAALLGTLPQRERDLLALKYGAAMTNRDIAKTSGLSESNIGTILHRTIRALRESWDAGD